MSTKKEVKAESVWKCETCSSEEMSFATMREHIQTKHSADPATTKFKKSLVMHVDGDKWFTNVYELTTDTPAGVLKLTNSTISPRHRNDPMRMA